MQPLFLKPTARYYDMPWSENDYVVLDDTTRLATPGHAASSQLEMKRYNILMGTDAPEDLAHFAN